MIRFVVKKYQTIYIYKQSPLTSLRTHDVTHSRFVTHFRILKIEKNKNCSFFIVSEVRFIVYF